MASWAQGILHTPEGRLRLGWRLLLFAVLLVGLYVLLALLVPATLAGHALALLLASLGAGRLLLGMEGRSLAALGFHLGREAVAESLKGLVLGVAVAVLAVLLIAAAGAVRWRPFPADAATWLAAGGLSFGVLALAAGAEEAMVRGYPIQALAQAWGPGAAVVVTSAAFGLLHGLNPNVGWVGLLNTGLAGLLLGALYLRTGSLWWPSGAHLGWNWAHGFVAGLPVSGVDVVQTPLIRGVATGPELMSGGAFGPEGSLLATAVLSAAAAWAWWTPRLAPSPAVRASPPLAVLRVTT